jgi:hypothetical protein
MYEKIDKYKNYNSDFSGAGLPKLQFLNKEGETIKEVDISRMSEDQIEKEILDEGVDFKKIASSVVHADEYIGPNSKISENEDSSPRSANEEEGYDDNESCGIDPSQFMSYFGGMDGG